MGKATYRDIPTLIGMRQAFSGNSMSAIAGPYSVTGVGALNSTERQRLFDDVPHILYTVYSYATPIAWVRNDGSTYVVEQDFSVTTSKHKGYARQGINGASVR